MVQAPSAWCSTLSRDSPLAEIRRRRILRFPCPQHKYSIFRMYWHASSNSFGGLSHRCHTGTRARQYEGSVSIEDHDVAFVNHSRHRKPGLADLGPWNVTRLEMSPPPCCSVRTFTVSAPKLSIKSPPGPTCRCLLTAPFEGFTSAGSQLVLPHRSRR